MDMTSTQSTEPLSTATGPVTVLSLTPSAIAKVKDFAAKMPDSAGKHFRVLVEGGGCSGMQYGFNFDEFRDGDTLIDCDDIKVLLDANSKDYVFGSTVDFVEDFKGSGFSVQNPKAKASCGCGTSFTV